MNLEEIIKEQTITIGLMQETINNLLKSLKEIRDDLDYALEDINAIHVDMNKEDKIGLAVRECQESIAELKNEPIGIIFTDVI